MKATTNRCSKQYGVRRTRGAIWSESDTLSRNMSLEERTLVVRAFDSRVHKDLLRELFVQVCVHFPAFPSTNAFSPKAGPVVNVVLRTDFAYIEFEHKASVGYALALLDGVCLYGRQLFLEPRVRDDSAYHFVDAISQFNHVMNSNPDFFRQFTAP
ncbi:unnamed protein product, partial [Oppiella nova]